MIEKTWKVTPALKSILGLATQEALTRGHKRVAAPHVLATIMNTPGAAGKMILSELGIGAEQVARKLDEWVCGAAPTQHGRPCAHGIMEDASSVAKKFGHEVIGTEHLLTGLLIDADAVGFFKDVVPNSSRYKRQMIRYVLNILKSSTPHQARETYVTKTVKATEQGHSPLQVDFETVETPATSEMPLAMAG
jgi:ATP-dependent Clp protease ATP-binding subunit ClpA